MAYRDTIIEEVVLPQFVGLPPIIDDFTLALRLGIRNKTLWWLVRSTRLPCSDRDSLYREGSVLKRGRAGKAGKRRPIHIPDDRLSRVQKILDTRVVQRIPVGDHVRAYEKGRVPVDTARLCEGSGILLTMDLRNFFGTIKLSHIRRMFMHYGYNRNVSSLMAQLCCCTAEDNKTRFMPQGTPVSPAIANRVANLFFDQKVIALSEAKGWKYLRYSDNIYLAHKEVLSREEVDAFKLEIIRTIRKSGWKVHKIRVAPKWRRQEVLGLVVNQKANLRSSSYRAIRALIHNCAAYGFESQVAKAREFINLKIDSPEALIAHIRGKISYVGQVLSENRREKLLEDFSAALEAERLRIRAQWDKEDQEDGITVEPQEEETSSEESTEGIH